VWTRDDQRCLFSALTAPPVPGAFVHATGGSTGEPTRFYVTRESYEWRMAMADRGYSWAEAEEGRRSVYVWGSPIKPLSWRAKIRADLSHRLQRRRYFDSFVFDDRCKEACCRAINRFKPHALVGYAGNLVELARFVQDHPGLLAWKSRTAVTAAEGLLPGQRELIESTLTDELFMSYGSREFSLIGMECKEHCGYHLSADNLLVEVVDEAGNPAAPGNIGRILVTDLRNDANPFIRYEIGDWGIGSDQPCGCGLPFPMLAAVNGRIQEFLHAADGTKVTALFVPHMMKEFGWVRGYQLVQAKPGSVAVRVIADGVVMATMTDPVAELLRGKLGSGTVVAFEQVAELKKSPSGKTQIVVSFVDNTTQVIRNQNSA